MAALPVVLCLTDLTDTTGRNFNGQTITGLGPLSFEAQRGISLHPSYAVSADREPLGLLVQCCMLDGAFKTDAFGRVVRRKPQRYRGIARICNDTAGTKARF